MDTSHTTAPSASPATTAIVEEYLEAIYNMGMEGDIVIGARLADKFRVAPPTVTETLKRMVRDDLILMDAKRQVTLTERGVAIAETVLRRHRLTERFLVDMLGMEWHQVHEEACRLEHQISGAVEQRVIAALNGPTTCPHGNPIPGCVPNARAYLSDHGAIRLLAAPPTQPYTILLISEVVEDEEGLISYLHDRGLTPGARVALATTPSGDARDPDAIATLRLGHPGSDHELTELTIPARVAYALWVTPVAA